MIWVVEFDGVYLGGMMLVEADTRDDAEALARRTIERMPIKKHLGSKWVKAQPVVFEGGVMILADGDY